MTNSNTKQIHHDHSKMAHDKHTMVKTETPVEPGETKLRINTSLLPSNSRLGNLLSCVWFYQAHK